MKKVGLVVEDKYPEAIKEISKKLGVKPIIRRQRGRISEKKASAFAKELLRSCEKVIILGDADCNEEGERERLQRIYEHLPEGLRERVHICIIVHELESWLLADENAISRVLGKNVKPVRILKAYTTQRNIWRNCLKRWARNTRRNTCRS